MTQAVRFGSRKIGSGHPVYLIAEIGINHNGDLNLAKKLIDLAKQTGFDAVKFQKRTPELCVPKEMQKIMRETPWGVIPYMEYRKRIEFGKREYQRIDQHCRQKKIPWFASCWDVPSVDFIAQFDVPGYKIASACLTHDPLLRAIKAKSKPVILSTGMSTMEEIRHAVKCLDRKKLVLSHSTSTYPCSPAELNLRMIETLRKQFGCPVGYSGHEVGLQTTYAASALGAVCIERHITLDRTLWGSDQAASVELTGMVRLVRDIRLIESALGDGIKRVYQNEIPLMKRLRKVGNGVG